MLFFQISCCRSGNSAALLAIKASSSGFDNKTCNSLEHTGAAPLTGFCLSTSRSIAGCTFMWPKTIILSNHGPTSLHKMHVHLWSHYHQLQVPCVAWIAATVQACADVAMENTKRHGCCHLSLLCLCSCVCILPVVFFWDCSCASSCGTDCGNRAGSKAAHPTRRKM